jgi:hypothetical protein
MEEEEHIECTPADVSVEEGYTAEHKLSKYELLNSLNINLMDTAGMVFPALFLSAR